MRELIGSSAGWRRAAGITVLVLLAAGAPGARASTTRLAVRDPAGYVNPLIGTAAGAANQGTGGGAANTFPGPVMPGGMIRLSPDTRPSSNNIGGGYDYADSQIRGFSLTHLSGPGCPNFGDIPFTPTTTPVTGSPVEPGAVDPSSRYEASFSHRDEAAQPGYYRVLLNPGSTGPIGVELTSAVRAGVARLTYPSSRSASLLINAGGSAMGDRTADVQVDPTRHEVSGSATSGGFCLQPDNYTVYFVIQFDHPFAAFGTWRKQLLEPGTTSNTDSFLGEPFAYYPLAGAYYHAGATAQTGAYVTFDPTAERAVELRVGISYVSIQAARANLEREVAQDSFEQIRSRARAAWNQALSPIEVRGGSRDQLRRFYTALYQAQIEPGTFSDGDGRYIGMDGTVHVARGYTQSANFSGWDIYRSQIPLLALISPRRASDAVRSILADALQSGWLPKWPLANGQTGVMTGDPADPIIASAYALGARGFDAGSALAAMVKGATQTGRSANDGYVEREGLSAYLRYGYIPNELNSDVATEGVGDWARLVPAPASEQAGLPWGSAGTTLEYASDDFAISRLAQALGRRQACRTFLGRSGNWRNLFDSAAGYIEPRSASGAFIPGYDPNSDDTASSEGFAEGDAAQYTWMIPQDPAGLFAAIGGRRAAAARLDTFFTQLNAGPSSPYAFLGDEPNLNSPWLYDWLGQPYRTQQVLRQALGTLYPDSAGGFPGNDDLGTMSAWYVLASIGLYPEIPGTDVLALSTPQFRRVTLHLPDRTVTLTTAGTGPYIRSLTVNGHRWPRPWIRLAQLRPGSRLDYRLSARPNPAWGAAPAAAPPSYQPASATACR